MESGHEKMKKAKAALETEKRDCKKDKNGKCIDEKDSHGKQ